MTDFLKQAEKAARSAGQTLLDWQDRISAREKGPKDLVTEADLAAQQEIRRILLGAYPDHEFLGEEDEDAATRTAASAGYRWIVDPLDGTANYVHRLQAFAVSIALQRAGETVVGVIYDPVLGDCYTGERQAGAQLNGQPIRTSGCTEIRGALAAASFSANVPRGSTEIRRFVEMLHECQAIRRLGSAALNLSYLAAGRLDTYFATSVKIWDVAAGLLIVQEAGGVMTSIDGGPFDPADPRFAASATAPLHEQVLATLRRARFG